MLVFRRALSDVPLLASESRVLRHMREVKEGLPLAHVRGSPFGGEVIIKRVDRFGRRRIKGKRGLSKRVIWAKQVVKQLYCNLRTKRLHKMVHTAVRAKEGFTQAIYFQLESRLDMFMRRCFLSPSLPAARQAIFRKLVIVNGTVANSASHQLNYGDVVQIKEQELGDMRRRLLDAGRTPILESNWKNGTPRYTNYRRQPDWGMPQQKDWNSLHNKFSEETGLGGGGKGQGYGGGQGRQGSYGGGQGYPGRQGGGARDRGGRQGDGRQGGEGGDRGGGNRGAQQ
ncbi:hypothetical protein T492DRAFT_919282 [Pavlovales sp. CCMP2436]|nr:hypothetical protein T492DRAFT_919282 [Pavlovales sp. CCMP2436]